MLLIYNPSVDVVKKTLPKKLKKPGYCKVPHIIDCTEIFIVTPSNPIMRASTWFDYKHHNTAKILVSVTSNGAFNFVSEACGGRASDVYLTKESGFYEILEPDDKVMADRGFTIAENLMLHRAGLFIPPGKGGQEQKNCLSLLFVILITLSVFVQHYAICASLFVNRV